jgi:hypothetical protein
MSKLDEVGGLESGLLNGKMFLKMAGSVEQVVRRAKNNGTCTNKKTSGRVGRIMIS